MKTAIESGSGVPIVRGNSQRKEISSVEKSAQNITAIIPIKAMGKPTMTAKSKFTKPSAIYYLTDYCPTIRAAFNRTSKFLRCDRIEVIVSFKTDDATLFGKPHSQKPDSTNILKGVEDALLIDDSGNEVKCSKHWGDRDLIGVILDGVQS